MSKGNRKIVAPKINVVSILDTVYIFIFFLLLNLRIDEFYQISTSKPIVRTVSSSQLDEIKGKHFKIKLTADKIQITEGAKEIVKKEFSWNPEAIAELHNYMVALKEQNPVEKSIVIKSRGDVKYKDVVRVVDTVQRRIAGIDKTSGKKTMNPVFDNLAFEKMR